MLKSIFAIVIVLFLIASTSAHASLRGESKLDSLPSKILGEKRELIVRLPNNYYQNTDLSYPVLYLLDGQRNFSHTAGTLDFLNQDGKSQEMIIIAIKNTHRSRDYTPTYDENYNRWGTSGGADNFLDFIEKELVPYVNKNYRANNFKILSGHSLGGLLALYSLQSRPHLFQAHFAFSPSIWWHNQVIMENAKTFFGTDTALNNFLYINLGNETGNMLTAFEVYTEILKTNARSEFSYHADIDVNESHGTTALIGQTHAFRHLYRSLQCPDEIIAQGLPAINAYYKKQSDKFGYPIQASYRAINSAGYNALKAKNFAKAIEIFRINVENYSYKADAYDSLADGLEANGQLNEALKMREMTIQKSLIENVENNAYKTRLINLKALISQQSSM
ncbi:alpha/beta hydrolase [Glaciecola sp. MH2013]|uniref:alpha/beta hydrolase n=1 Tax=Glaciecola sp. MH2013 TaxID=2785524 RepID=UPI00189CE6F6|nr:alpha/beta hydrolase-fold protein [Glaciecola sp. MH2013]MBF7074949.1 alpha/beta hydrolase [Glaciecola sp. MH2013]